MDRQFGVVAQLVERDSYKIEVVGSSPTHPIVVTYVLNSKGDGSYYDEPIRCTDVGAGFLFCWE